jgi:hypothetical protein
MKFWLSMLPVAALSFGLAYSADPATFLADNIAVTTATPDASVPATLFISAAKGRIGMATMVTNSRGQARYRFMVPEGMALDLHTVAATFAEGSASGSTLLKVFKGPARLEAANVRGHAGAWMTLSASLRNAANEPLSGATLTFHLPANVTHGTRGPMMDGAALIFGVPVEAVGSATTDVTGMASMPYAISPRCARGDYPVVVTFGGDASHLPRTNAARLTVR